jgi:MurNAc alpha-1-phosphate uridylyltransferase
MSGQVDTAMVLAAGFGTRMRPLTESRPKPLVVLDGHSLLDRVLDKLSDAGIRRAVVNVHYHADQIEAAVARRRSPEVIISDERDALLDTGGGVVRALPLLGDRPFLIHNSDSVWIEGVEPNLSRLLRAWDPDRMDCLMLLAMTRSSLGFEGHGDFSMALSGLLRRRKELDACRYAGCAGRGRACFDGIAGLLAAVAAWPSCRLASGRQNWT